ncbi:MAG: PilC/PilY family type IV pilus protein [Betaproteobacteria bacterium]|nr:PilC/PilY family type IV pilus protein [Betaproteobacteria bacterium]
MKHAIRSSFSASFPQKALFWLAAALFPGLALPQATPDFDIEQIPLIAGGAVAPNLVYIHDDSSSMSWTYMPDSSLSAWTNPATVASMIYPNPSGAGTTTLSFAAPTSSHNMYSSTWNTVFYNPDMIYQPPLQWQDAGGGKGRLVRMRNSDTLSVFPSIRRNGYPTRSYSATNLALDIVDFSALNTGSNTADNLGVGIRTLSGAFSSGNISAGNLEPNNGLAAAIYYDYVPGFHSMRDNPNYSQNYTQNPGARLEDDQRNYEYWAFRTVTAGQHFRTNGSTPALLNRTAAANRSIVVSRACPTVFSDVDESRDYYGRGASPGTGIDNPHGHCRVNYRSDGVTGTSSLSGFSTTTGTSPNSRPWCQRSNGYNYRTDGNGNFGCVNTRGCSYNSGVAAPACNCNGYDTSMTPLAWQPYPASAAATATSNIPAHLTCHAGRHVIGDSTGKGYYDPAVDLAGNYVSYFEYSGQVTGATRSSGSHADIAAANCIPRAGQPGVCTNLYGPEQSRLHLVTHYIGDDGELEELPTPQRRTVRQEIRNFMNWYSYYRNRSMASKAGMTEAFAYLVDRNDTSKPNAAMNNMVIRLGYDTINSSSMGQSTFANADGGNIGVGSATFFNFASPDLNTPPNARYGPHRSTRGGIGVVPFLDFPGDALNPDGTLSPYRNRQFVRRFYDWILGMPAPNNTPLTSSLVAAGEYYRNDAPWLDYPPIRSTDTGSGGRDTCRRSFSILMTDGYSQHFGAAGCAGVGSHTCTNGTNIQWPDGTVAPTYTPQVPFTIPATSAVRRSTLGDWAMFYWKNDLKPDMDNDVVPTSRVMANKKNVAFWQHMQTFTLGFGIQGTLSAPELKDYLANPANWDPTTGAWSGAPISWDFLASSGGASKVDELFHAGIAGHGDFFDTKNAREFAEALREMFTAITGGVSTQMTFAGMGGQGAEDRDLNFRTNYNPEAWSGEIYAYRLCSPATLNQTLFGGAAVCTAKYYGAPLENPEWTASDQLNAQYGAPGSVATRKVFTWNGSTGAPFDAGMASGNLTADVINYVRGDKSLEIVNGGTFRSRQSLLGDVVNPMPYLLGNYEHNDYGYGGYRCDSSGTYIPPRPGIVYSSDGACAPIETSFLAAWQIDAYQERILDFRNNGRVETVFVAANDGMLHAFAGGINNPNGGRELFAYVPRALHGQLEKLTEPGYQQKHHYFVDGAPWVGDILLNGNWTSVLVGSTGRGRISDDNRVQNGSFFAMVVEDPENFTENDVLWEFTHPDLGAPVDIDPVIVAVPGSGGSGHRWAAVFGNGYNSQSGCAGLFIVPLEPGGHLNAEFIPADCSGGNGLGSPYLIDLSFNGRMDVAYAGDMNGVLWKFDLATKTVERVLEARSVDGMPQPINAPPTAVCVLSDEDCTYGVLREFQLIGGTGKYFEKEDLSNAQTQSIYGVRLTHLGAPLGGVATRSRLQTRVYDPDHPGRDTFYRESTVPAFTTKAWKLYRDEDGAVPPLVNPPVDYPTQNGYVIDLNGPSTNRMGTTQVRSQGTALRFKPPDFLMPFAIMSDGGCGTGDLGGGYAEFDSEQGTWIKSSLFRRIADDANIWVHPDATGAEVNRDSKYELSSSVFEATPSDGLGRALNRVIGPRYSIPISRRMKSVNLPDPYVILGGRAGRQSWRQIR